ncbi:sigma-70 family RNA polymerase sigma factor [Sphingomonas naphthae]|uniref:Sigma-70 family RNA polymerase sigma factor n=1 Tax=Sphingomonas naphthae TaxID=1813468 RepID=A0ABY7TMV1_9SPHN|nr:sigma-70 family RNA polymerase sigma factor [Sphingomonas naphthae]WCT74338.1 sigma-70 family RNA polymerase sigma factor [Sphingomonas naphthae]
MLPSGLEAVFLENRERLLRFVAAHGAGEAAEDVLQELWLKVSSAESGPVANPLSYLYRAANNVMLDRYRSRQAAAARDHAWTEAATTAPGRSDEPSGERRLIAREQLAAANAALDALGTRVATAFRRHRIDGVAQRQVAAELGVSLSTVEADLRVAYRAMIDLRKTWDG